MMTRRRFLMAIGAVGGFGAAAVLWVSHRNALPVLAGVCPLPLRPRDPAPHLVPERARAVLALAAPCHALSYSEVVHALRLWGPTARWDHPGCFGGQTLLAVVLDEDAWAAFFPGQTHFARNPEGWYHRVVGPGWQGDSHAGYSLSVLAELEVPADYPIRAGGRLGHVLDLLRGGLWEFSWQGEWEWWATAFARYLPPALRWHNKDGAAVTLSQIAERLSQRPMGAGECYGTHALLALVTLVCVDGVTPFLATVLREQVEGCLRAASERLTASQHVSGLWGTAWHTGDRHAGLEDPNNHLVVTGHSLEWLAWCPAALRPASAVLGRALDAMVNLMLEHGTGPHGSLSYAPFTHAARALRLWRGEVPTVADASDHELTRSR